MTEKLKYYEVLSKINVNDKTEKKKTGSTELTYLSWAFAVDEVTKLYPDFDYEVKWFEGKPYLYDENLGYMVFTSVTIEGKTKSMWLPVMDGANNAMFAEPYTYQVKDYKTGKMYDKQVAAADMFDINKTIMRCLVKNLGMFGLGLYIYAGEDLPTGEEKVVVKPRGETTANKKKYQSYLDCLDRTDTKEKWDKVKPLKDEWVTWAETTYGIDYSEQLNDKFLMLAQVFEPIDEIKY